MSLAFLFISKLVLQEQYINIFVVHHFSVAQSHLISAVIKVVVHLGANECFLKKKEEKKSILRQDQPKFSLLPSSVQSCFHIMDMCHSRPGNTVFDALNHNTDPFSRPAIAAPTSTSSAGPPLAYKKIPVHPQVCWWSVN